MKEDPGKFTERVQILAPTDSRGASGEALVTWGDYGTRWMKVEILSGSETVNSDVILPVSRAKFTMRYNADLTEEYRLEWNSQLWDISSINVLGRKAFLEVIAESNSLQGGAGGAYPVYYNTTTSKVRTVTGVAVTAGDPSQTNIDSDVGLTAAEAGTGYECAINYVEDGSNRQLRVTSSGSYWFYYAAVNIKPLEILINGTLNSDIHNTLYRRHHCGGLRDENIRGHSADGGSTAVHSV